MTLLLAALLSCSVSAGAEPFLDGLQAYEAKEYYKARDLFQASADEGNDYAQAYLAHLYSDKDQAGLQAEKTLELYRKAAQAGNAAGEFGMGRAYEGGVGVERSAREAVKHYRAADEAGFVPATVDLAALMIDSPEFKDNPVKLKEAVSLLRRVADKGGVYAGVAMADVAWCHWYGKGLPEDRGETFRWARKAAQAMGDKERLSYLDCVESGRCTGLSIFHWAISDWNQDGQPGREETRAWLRRDAKAGRASAQYIQGAMAEEGFDDERKNVKEAVSWYKKAAKQGYAPAVKRLEALAPDSAPKPAAPPAVAAAPAAPASYSSDVDKPAFKRRERPDDFAFIVGVEKYKNVPEARFAERDAAAFRAHAAALGVPERNIIFLAGDAATKTKIQAYLDEWLPKNVKEDSTLFFFYSGHGAPDVETRQAFLLPWDADPQFLQSTAYALKDVYASLNRLKARRVLVALDSCFSGAGGRSVLAPGLRPLVTQIAPTEGAGRLVIFAAASGEQASGTLDDQGHGVFTYYFLKGLAAAPREGEALTVSSLYNYLKPRVEDASARQNRNQTPQLSGAGDEIVLPSK